jgi:hypothetical protein
MWFQQMQQQIEVAPINLTLIIITAINGLFMLVGGWFHAKMPGQIATAITTSLRPPPMPGDRLEDTVRAGRGRV